MSSLQKEVQIDQGQGESMLTAGPNPAASSMSTSRSLRIFGLCMFLTMTVFVVDLLVPLGVAGGVPYITVILVSLWLDKPKITLAFAVATSVFTVLGFLFSPAGGELWKILANRGLAVFAIWVTALLGRQRLLLDAQRAAAVREAEEALAQVRRLRRLVPICSWCKKIRDHKGAWQEVEVYMRDHSKTDFSHSICPVCMRERYADYMI